MRSRSQSGLRFGASVMKGPGPWRTWEARVYHLLQIFSPPAPALGRPRLRSSGSTPSSIIDAEEPGLLHKTCFYESLLGATSVLEQRRGSEGTRSHQEELSDCSVTPVIRSCHCPRGGWVGCDNLCHSPFWLSPFIFTHHPGDPPRAGLF